MSKVMYCVVQDTDGTRTLDMGELVDAYLKVHPAASVEMIYSRHLNRGLPTVGAKIEVFRNGQKIAEGERKDWVNSKTSGYTLYQKDGSLIEIDSVSTEWGYI